ncbi:MAG: rod shape-determining protein RodA [bacterium]|nr:rod shape-determining protein RodA [bacterium]
MIQIWRSIRYFDWVNFALTCIIACIGLLFVFSATYTTEQPFSLFFKKQSFGLVSGLAIYGVFAFSNHRTLIRHGYVTYFCIIGLLLFTLLKGSIGMGAQRWIDVFFFRFQPSELVKLLLPAFIAYHVDLNEHTARSFRSFVPILTLIGLSCLLIVKQPDLGTALLILFVGALLLWLAGIGNKFFIYSFIAIALCTPLLWNILKPYQKNRIAVFLGQGEARKERYQIEQSAIAIGSGGLMGKGFLNGTQNKLHFLPEGRTDFIFAVLAEEFGFIGTIFVLFLYFLLFLRLFAFIEQIADAHVQLLATGLLMHIVFSVLINIGMVTNLLPIVGIPLPLMSYGSSNLWITCASLGWLQAINMRERE